MLVFSCSLLSPSSVIAPFVKRGGLTLLLCIVAITAALPVEAASLRQLFEKSSPSVVVVRTLSKNSAPGEKPRGEVGLGSGVLISADGKVLTAAHVVQAVDRIEIVFSNGKTAPARVVSTIVQADVALLQAVEVPAGILPAPMGDSDLTHVGDPVFVIGAPYGLSYSLTSGFLSARRTPKEQLSAGVPIVFLQTDAAINSGNSGGPMFNMEGQVIGIVSHIQSRSGGFEGLGFAVSSNTAKKALLERPGFWSGVEGVVLSDALSAMLNVPQKQGILVQRVAEGSPSALLGVRAGHVPAKIGGDQLLLGGDIILYVGDFQVQEDQIASDKINTYLRSLKSGDRLSLRVLREGHMLDLEAPLP